MTRAFVEWNGRDCCIATLARDLAPKDITDRDLCRSLSRTNSLRLSSSSCFRNSLRPCCSSKDCRSAPTTPNQGKGVHASSSQWRMVLLPPGLLHHARGRSSHHNRSLSVPIFWMLRRVFFLRAQFFNLMYQIFHAGCVHFSWTIIVNEFSVLFIRM